MTSGTGVKLWPINNYTLGGVAEYRKHFAWGGDLLLGYWGEDAKPEPPPLGQQLPTAIFGAPIGGEAPDFRAPLPGSPISESMS